jgi:hypothetical protein
MDGELIIAMTTLARSGVSKMAQLTILTMAPAMAKEN